ncbi:MAG TPA: universal stress protein [Solirubrobacteraceae bacterium]|jgi:nucleotide-binding universal stress UspA family protein
MFETIVVGVEGREGGRAALALAGALQRALGSHVVAVTAYPHDHPLTRGSSPAYDAAVEEDAERVIAAEATAAGLEARALAVPDSSPARALHHVAEREGAGLIIVGSDHQGPAGRVLAGGVTNGTLYGAPCPVAVAPLGLAGTAATVRTVGVGYDASPESERALELAVNLAGLTNAKLELMCVLAAPVPPGEESTALVTEAARAIGDRASVWTAQGVPDVELARRSSQLDLLVIGSRGYGPLRRLMLGSTSVQLVRSASCPVIVLPRGAEETAAPPYALAATGDA